MSNERETMDEDFTEMINLIEQRIERLEAAEMRYVDLAKKAQIGATEASAAVEKLRDVAVSLQRISAGAVEEALPESTFAEDLIVALLADGQEHHIGDINAALRKEAGLFPSEVEQAIGLLERRGRVREANWNRTGRFYALMTLKDGS